MDCAAPWCVIAHICVQVSVVAAVNNHKVSTTLTRLRLANNKVADAGATALAEALKATVCRFISSCSRHVLLMTTDVTSQSGMKRWRRQVAVQFVYTASVFFMSSRKALTRASSSEADVARFQNRLGRFSSELHASHSPLALA